MDNILLGKSLKAMYKLSGKTLAQLSEETDLTIDTINNLFYSRVQKPGFFGVCSLVQATGHSVSELCGFMEAAKELPAEADFTEELAKYVISVRDTVPIAAPAVLSGPSKPDGDESGREQPAAFPEEYEKQLDRYRSLHLFYVDQLNHQYREQIGQMKKSNLLLMFFLLLAMMGDLVLVFAFWG